MLENDVQLIRKVLSGDDSAFRPLVEKYQKGVHALVWRKIGDFHHAEEITQDTFVQAYRKLATLRSPHHFPGWLYVIANRLSLNWLQRHKQTMQSLEDTPVREIETSDYKNYMSEKRLREVAEHRAEVVKELLEKLPESERTVVTLYYLGEMTTPEIGQFLGVSVNTIRSRLRRGRKRLQASESWVREVLGGVQLSADLTENVMRQVADMKPTATTASKPLIPWAAFGATTVLVLLMLGVGNHYLSRFQRPYSFEAESEPTIEIVETPIVLDSISKPTLRKQVGQISGPGKNIGPGTQVAEVTLRTNPQADRLNFSTGQWTQTYGPPGGHVYDIFATSQEAVYVVSPTGQYKLASDATAWTRVNANIPVAESLMPMAEDQGRLYLVSTDEIFASTDNGEVWNAFCSRPKGSAIGLIITDAAPDPSRPADMTMYLALREEGIFRSTDGGMHWNALNDGLRGKRITAIAGIEKTVFAGTTHGLYRLDSGFWKQLPVGTSETVYSLTVFGNDLYVAMGDDLFGSIPKEITQMIRNNISGARIFYSADLGASWEDITPEDEFSPGRPPSAVKVLAVGETLFALGSTQFRSTDGGKNWKNLGIDTSAFMINNIPSVAVNERTFYKVGAFGIRRSTDGGESWHLFMNGVLGTRIVDLVAFNKRLYAYNGYEVFQSSDTGVSWKNVRVSAESVNPAESGVNLDYDSKLLVAGNMLYLFSPTRSHVRIFRLSVDGDVLIPVQDIPTLEREGLASRLGKGSEKTKQTHFIEKPVKTETLAISRDVFYVEHRRGLYKWRRSDSEWTHTGLADTRKQSDDVRKGFKLAVSEETVYVGKRDGQLFQSRDGGDSWRDVTPNLPLRFTHFNGIVFAGSRVYVLTDKGVLISERGEHWQVVTDGENQRPVINKIAVAGGLVYGAGDTSVYRLKPRGKWEQIASDIPDDIVTLALLNNRLYGVTQQHRMFYMLLDPVY